MRRARYSGSSRPGTRRVLSGTAATIAVMSLLAVGFVAPAGAQTDPPAEPAASEARSPEVPPEPETSPGWTEAPTDPGVPTDPGAPTDPAEPTDPASPDPATSGTGTPGEDVLGPDAPAPDAPDAPDPAPEDATGADPGVTPFLIPPATGNNAVVSVKTGGDRTSLVAVGPLAGVTLQLYDGVAAPTTPVADAWATCVSDADGDCSFVVPDTQLGGPNYDRRFWVVQSGVPGSWYTNPTLGTGSDGSTVTPYRFRTGTLLRAGNTYTSQGNFMLATGNTNATASGGIWQSSRVNPTFPAQCGIDVALVLDLSGSVAPDLPELKAAANQFVASLTGTPSNMGLFTFSSLAPAAGNPNLPLTPVSTPESAQLVTDQINDYTAVGGTNWDRGIYQVATDPHVYDVAVVITDGNPTFYGNQEGPGNFTRLRETENGVFSANAVKAQGTHMVAFGVGDGIDSVGSGLNLRAISGQVAGTDYFQTTDYAEAGDQLRELALGNCAGSVSVVKQVVPSTAPVGSIDGAEPSGGWELTSESQSAGVTVNAPTTAITADGTGAANFDLTFAGGTTTGTVGVMETQQNGFTLQQVGGANAVCTNLATGAGVTVTNSGATGFLVPVSTTAAVSCTIYNRAPSPVASLVLNKTWVVNGQTYANGQQPGALTAAALVAGTSQPWAVPRTGLQEGQTVAIAETTTNGLQGCTITSQRVTAVNGATVDLALPSSVTLVAGANSAVITNVVTCTSTLTLAKEVQGGPAAPTGWTLDAVAPSGALGGPNGVVGSPGATALVTPGVVYPLAESGGDPNYAQATGPNAVLVPGSTGSWLCVELAADGTTVIPGFSDGLNGGVNVPLGRWIRCTAVNQAATVNVQKFVENRFGGTAVPADWSLTVTPIGTVPPGVVAQTVTGSNVATAITVRPGVTYTVSESGLPAGYTQTAAGCTVTEAPRGLTFTLQRLDTANCSFTNADAPARLTLVKQVETGTTGAVEVPASWTLTASPDDITGQAEVSGHGDPTSAGGVSQVEVFAGTYDLTESAVAGYTAGDWSCTGATVTSARVTIPVGGDVTCTIVNRAQQPTLTLVKDVDNGTTGGTATPEDWTLTATGPTTGVSGPTGSPAVTTVPVAIGDYVLSETGPPGYAAGPWTCTGGTLSGSTVTVALGDAVTCTVLNTAQQPSLTLVKQVVNDDGGAADPTDWTLAADGPTPLTGTSGDPSVTGVDVLVGDYALSEAGGPVGYLASDWTCVVPATGDGVPTPVPVDGSTVTVGVGQTVVCTIVNDDVGAPFTVVKSSDPGDGATVLPGDVITYTVTATTVGEGFGSQVVVTDDLAAVLDHATFVQGSIVTSAGSANLVGTTLTWNVGDLLDAETVSYQVRVAPGAYGVTLTNVVTAPGAEPCVETPAPPATDQVVVPTARTLAAAVSDDAAATDGAAGAVNLASPTALAVVDPTEACRTTSHRTPAWTLTKSSDPASGSRVAAGSTITYTLTATSTTAAPVTGAVVTDDLSKVLAYGTLVATPAGATISGSTLTWAVPDLTTAGATATLTYQVRLASNAWGVTVTNLATPGPGGGCVVCTTTHQVPPPSTGGLAFTGAGAGLVAGAALLVLLGTLLVGARRRARG